MNSYQKLFKTNIYEGVSKLIQMIGVRATIGYAIYFLISTLLTGLLFASLLRDTGLTIEDFQNPSSITELTEIFSDLMVGGQAIIGFIIIYILLVLLISWINYFGYHLSNAEVKGTPLTFGGALSQSLDGRLLNVIGVTISVFVITMVLFVVLVGIFAALGSMLLVFLAMLITLFLAMKFLLVIPAYILGDKDIVGAYQFSFMHMTASRVFRIFGLAFVMMIALLLLSLVISIISNFLSAIPVLGQALGWLINILLGGLFLTLFISATTALYYRFADDIEGESQFAIEDNLINEL